MQHLSIDNVWDGVERFSVQHINKRRMLFASDSTLDLHSFDPRAQEVKNCEGIDPSGSSDTIIRRERESLKGPRTLCCVTELVACIESCDGSMPIVCAALTGSKIYSYS